MKAGTYLKSVGSASQEYITFLRNLLYNFKPLQKKRMVKLKCSTYFPYIFSKFSSNFLQLFQMTKLNCFHHHRSTDVCTNTGIGKTFYSKECFLCKNSSTGCTTSASTAPVPVVATSHMTSRVCVCVCVCQDEFLSHISSCALSQSINWQKCHNKTGSFE